MIESYIEKINQDLIALGTYRPELDQAIRELAMLRMLCDKNNEEWAAKGYPMTEVFVNKNGTENIVKSQYLQNHQQLDDKILRREKELGLTTYSMDKLGVLERKEEDQLTSLIEAFR